MGIKFDVYLEKTVKSLATLPKISSTTLKENNSSNSDPLLDIYKEVKEASKGFKEIEPLLTPAFKQKVLDFFGIRRSENHPITLTTDGGLSNSNDFYKILSYNPIALIQNKIKHDAENGYTYRMLYKILCSIIAEKLIPYMSRGPLTLTPISHKWNRSADFQKSLINYRESTRQSTVQNLLRLLSTANDPTKPISQLQTTSSISPGRRAILDRYRKKI